MNINKVHKLWSFATAIIMTTFLLSSCGGTKNIKDQVYTGVDDALLWKIESKNLAQPSYLYGTIHMIESKDFFLPEGTLTAIDASKRLVFEIDMTEMSDMSGAMGIMKSAFMQDNLTLKDLLTEDEYTMVNDHFTKIGLPLFLFERIKPMFLTVFASSDFDPNGLKDGTIKSYEMEFMEMATQSAKPIGGLESIEFQMSIFDSIPYESQADMLVETLQNSDTSSDSFKDMVNVYKSQDLDGMVSMISEDEDGIGEFEDVMLNNRNKNWIPVMAELMKKETVFFAVGAGHLAGKEGVIHLLRKDGYKLTPISNQK